MAERHHKHIILKWAVNPDSEVYFLSPGGVWTNTSESPNWVDIVSYKLVDSDGQTICMSYKKEINKVKTRKNKFKIGW